MQVSFSMINYVCLYAIFLTNGGILLPLVTFADAEQQGLRVANDNHEEKSMVVEQQHQQEGEEQDHHAATTKSIVNNNDLSIRYENVERFLKSKFVKKLAEELGQELVTRLIENGDSSSSSCDDDLRYLENKSLPFEVDSDTYSKACEVQKGWFGDIVVGPPPSKTVRIDCDYELSPLFLHNFKLSCEDSKLFMTLLKVSIFPGDDNVYFYCDDSDILCELDHIEHFNAPTCLPRSCSYTEAKTLLDSAAVDKENVNGYESVSYILNTPYDPTSGASTLSTGKIVAIIGGIGGALILALYLIRNHKKERSSSEQ